MLNEYKTVKLGNILNIQSSSRIFEKEYVSHGVPFYRSKEIIEKHNGNDVSTNLFISEERFNKIKQTYSVPKHGDILLTSVGTIGIPYVVRENEKFYFKDGNLTWFNNFSKQIDNQYFYYWLLSDVGKEALNSILIGTTQKALTIKDLKTLEISLPPLPEQHRIANILSSFDNKIELLKKENNTLEDIAQSIFKEWFVKYNFPNKDGKPYRDNNGKMIDSELGLIPEGWRVGKLGELVNIKYGKNLPTNKLSHIGYPVFGANGLIGYHSQFMYEDQQVLVSCRGEASGEVNISLPFSFITNNSLILEIFNREDLSFEFLKEFSLKYQYKNYTSGSAQPQITIDTLKEFAIVKPSKEINKEFAKNLKSFNTKRLKINSLILILTKQRNILLHKLIK